MILPTNISTKFKNITGLKIKSAYQIPYFLGFDKYIINDAYVIRTLGISSREIDARVYGALKVVGLENKAKSKPTELSGGEQQRVSIARAIVNGPPLLIADEPTGNLDPKNSMEVMEILDQVNKRGITILVSTHDQAIVNYYRKRVITLCEGQIIKDVQAGTYG